MCFFSCSVFGLLVLTLVVSEWEVLDTNLIGSHICLSNEGCILNCSVNSCPGFNYECSSNVPCIVQCKQNDSCKSITINASTASILNISVSGNNALESGIIYSPSNNSGYISILNGNNAMIDSVINGGKNGYLSIVAYPSGSGERMILNMSESDYLSVKSYNSNIKESSIYCPYSSPLSGTNTKPCNIECYDSSDCKSINILDSKYGILYDVNIRCDSNSNCSNIELECDTSYFGSQLNTCNMVLLSNVWSCVGGCNKTPSTGTNPTNIPTMNPKPFTSGPVGTEDENDTLLEKLVGFLIFVIAICFCLCFILIQLRYRHAKQKLKAKVFRSQKYGKTSNSNVPFKSDGSVVSPRNIEASTNGNFTTETAECDHSSNNKLKIKGEKDIDSIVNQSKSKSYIVELTKESKKNNNKHKSKISNSDNNIQIYYSDEENNNQHKKKSRHNKHHKRKHKSKPKKHSKNNSEEEHKASLNASSLFTNNNMLHHIPVRTVSSSPFGSPHIPQNKMTSPTNPIVMTSPQMKANYNYNRSTHVMNRSPVVGAMSPVNIQGNLLFNSINNNYYLSNEDLANNKFAVGNLSGIDKSDMDTSSDEEDNEEDNENNNIQSEKNDIKSQFSSNEDEEKDDIFETDKGPLNIQKKRRKRRKRYKKTNQKVILGPNGQPMPIYNNNYSFYNKSNDSSQWTDNNYTFSNTVSPKSNLGLKNETSISELSDALPKQQIKVRYKSNNNSSNNINNNLQHPYGNNYNNKFSSNSSNISGNNFLMSTSVQLNYNINSSSDNLPMSPNSQYSTKSTHL